MSPTSRTHQDERSALVAYDHGAHLASWDVDGAPVIWLSERAVLDGSAPIRGGVPICFPWFADGRDGRHSPSHGVARTATWTPLRPDDGELWVWELGDEDVVDAPGATLVPGPFRARYAVRLTTGQDRSPTLQVELQMHNPGREPYRVEAALHTYLAVQDVRETRIEGLAGAPYLDKLTGRRESHDGDLVLTGHTDRVYDHAGPLLVDDRAGARQVEVRPTGATQTVVWNPGEDAAGIADLGAGSWQRFVCVETAATADQDLLLAPGGSATLGCSFHPTPRPTHVRA